MKPARSQSRPFSRIQGLVGWATLAASLFLVFFFGGNSPIYWIPFGVFVLALFMAQVLLVAVRGSHPASLRLIAPATLFVCATGWGLIQTIPIVPSVLAHPFWDLEQNGAYAISATPTKSRQSVFLLGIYAMVFWIALEAAQNRERALTFLEAIAVFSTGLATFGIFAVLSGANPILGAQATSNVSASFVNRNSYALFSGFGVIVNLSLYFRLVGLVDTASRARTAILRDVLEQLFSRAWIFLLGAIICLSALLLTASRAGVVVGLIGVGVVVVQLRSRSSATRWVWLFFGVVLISVLVALSGNVLNRFQNTGEDARFVIYPEIMMQLGDRLLLGNGFGAFEETFRPYVPIEIASKNWSFAHNTYLENLWEMGLPAALAFYGALCMVAAVVVRGVLTRRRDRLFPVTACACIVAGALHSLVDFSLQMPATAAMFAFILGVGWAHAWPSDEVEAQITKRRAKTESE